MAVQAGFRSVRGQVIALYREWSHPRRGKSTTYWQALVLTEKDEDLFGNLPSSMWDRCESGDLVVEQQVEFVAEVVPNEFNPRLGVFKDAQEFTEVEHTMVAAGLPMKFVADVQKFRATDSGVQDLVELWMEAQDRNGIEADLQEILHEDLLSGDLGPVTASEVRSRTLAVSSFRQWLSSLVERHGGEKLLAMRIGVPTAFLKRLATEYRLPSKKSAVALESAEREQRGGTRA